MSYPSEKPGMQNNANAQEASPPYPPQPYPPQPYPEVGHLDSSAPEYSAGNVPTVTQQPQLMPGMTMRGGNKNVKGLPVNANGRDWSHDLFSCFDESGLCLAACCCSCFVYQKNKNRLDHLNDKGTPDPERGGSGSGGMCCAHLCLNMCCGLGWVLQLSTRASVRARYNIVGDSFMDCLTSYFCAPCELVQDARELELEENSFGRTGDATAPYTN